MDLMPITIVKNSKKLPYRLYVAETFWPRLFGLLGSKLDTGKALLIKSCSSIHTVGLKYPIDVLFLDAKNRIVSIRENLCPNRAAKAESGATSVLELPPGAVKLQEINVGDQLELKRDLNQ